MYVFKKYRFLLKNTGLWASKYRFVFPEVGMFGFMILTKYMIFFLFLKFSNLNRGCMKSNFEIKSFF